MYRVFEATLDIDLGPYSRLLWQRRIPHRIFRPEGAELQLLAVAKAEEVPQALALYGSWRRGEIAPSEQDSAMFLGFTGKGELLGGVQGALRQAPFTLLLILVCCALLYLAPLIPPNQLTFDLLYPDFSYGTRRIILSQVLENFDLRTLGNMVSPILLHGGLLHLAFNMLWLWELGRQIERRQSTLAFGALIVALALVSNTVQYLWGGGNNFGGMSGVVYGLFAYIWMWQLFDPRHGLALPRALIWFMLLSLVLMTALGLSMIANAAHMGGFFAGVVFGALLATVSRIRRAVRV